MGSKMTEAASCINDKTRIKYMVLVKFRGKKIYIVSKWTFQRVRTFYKITVLLPFSLDGRYEINQEWCIWQKKDMKR